MQRRRRDDDVQLEITYRNYRKEAKGRRWRRRRVPKEEEQFPIFFFVSLCRMYVLCLSAILHIYIYIQTYIYVSFHPCVSLRMNAECSLGIAYIMGAFAAIVPHTDVTGTRTSKGAKSGWERGAVCCRTRNIRRAPLLRWPFFCLFTLLPTLFFLFLSLSVSFSFLHRLFWFSAGLLQCERRSPETIIHILKTIKTWDVNKKFSRFI